MLYLWEHRQSPPSEYSIGIDVFGRKPDFDPKTDSTVRVQVSRLRQRLKEYYEQEGANDKRRVVIPMGDYRVEIHGAPAAPFVVEPEAALSPLKSKVAPRPWIYWGLALQAIALVLLASYTLYRPALAPPSLHPFWTPLAHAGKSVHIIVPAPQFFRWEGLPYVVRDFGVNSVDQVDSSEFLTFLRDKYGTPQTLQLYTVASDTLAASSVARYLQDRGVPANVLDSPGVSLELRSTQDTIVFVGPGTISQLSPLTETNFYLKPARIAKAEQSRIVSGNGVVNRNPAPGEPSFYQDTMLAPLRYISYGVLARLPGKAPGTRMVLFASTYNPALASVATTESELDSVEEFHRQHGSDEYFEIVIRYERNADRVLRAKPVAYRSVSTH